MHSDTESELLVKDALLANSPMRVTMALSPKYGSYSLTARGDKERVESVVLSVQKTFRRQRARLDIVPAAIATQRLCAKRGIVLTLEIG